MIKKMEPKERDKRKSHISSKLHRSIYLLIMLRHPVTMTFTTLHYTSLHFTTLVDTSLPLI